MQSTSVLEQGQLPRCRIVIFPEQAATYLPHHNQCTSYIGRRTLRRVDWHRRALWTNT